MQNLTATQITVSQRLALKARAHALNPVVMIGNAGLTDAVVAEAARALKSHELIKIKVAIDDREARAAVMTQLCQQLGAAPVQQIGKMLVIYLQNLDIAMPIKQAPRRDKAKKRTKKQLAGR